MKKFFLISLFIITSLLGVDVTVEQQSNQPNTRDFRFTFPAIHLSLLPPLQADESKPAPIILAKGGRAGGIHKGNKTDRVGIKSSKQTAKSTKKSTPRIKQQKKHEVVKNTKKGEAGRARVSKANKSKQSVKARNKQKKNLKIAFRGGKSAKAGKFKSKKTAARQRGKASKATTNKAKLAAKQKAAKLKATKAKKEQAAKARTLAKTKQAKAAKEKAKAAKEKKKQAQLAAKKAQKPCCFVAGTPVKVANGYKAIEAIQVGDEVYAMNPETGEVALKAVTDTYIRSVENIKTFYELEVENVAGERETLRVTGEHPFWDKAQAQWVDVDDLATDAVLMDIEGKPLRLAEKKALSHFEQTYNITVNDYHNYFVSSSNLLVHNCSLIRPTSTKFSDSKVITNNKKFTYTGKANSVYSHVTKTLVNLKTPKEVKFIVRQDGNSKVQVHTNITSSALKRTLVKNGFRHTLSKDGKADRYVKSGTEISVRYKSRSYGQQPTADMKLGGKKGIVAEIRMKK